MTQAAALPVDIHAESVDDLLSRWHHWRMGYTPCRGHSGKAAVVGDYITSRQYDDSNGTLDNAIETSIMRQVDFDVSELSSLSQIALQVQARALYLGMAVFRSPRLPQDRVELQSVIRVARRALVDRLLLSGVLQ